MKKCNTKKVRKSKAKIIEIRKIYRNAEAAPGGVLWKKVLLKILQIWKEKDLRWSLFLIKFHALGLQLC